MKRILAGVATTALALGGMLVATAAPASAHTPDASATCTTLSVNLGAYRGATVTVTVDGSAVATEQFDRNWSKSFPLDGSTSHTWSIDVDAHDSSSYDWQDSGTTEPCLPTTPEQPKKSEAQVAIYLYPKIHKDRPAAWENSGLQTLVGTTTVEWTKDSKRDGTYWYTELPETSILDEIDLCTDWGIQQDLLRGGPDEYEVPKNIQFPDGTLHDAHLMDWTHQELAELGISLPTGENCDGTPNVPETPEPPVDTPDEVVAPVPPAAVTVCGSTSSDIELPVTTGINYLSTEQGVLAVPADGYAFGEDLGGYTRTDDGDVIFPLENLLPSAEECALVPGDVAAVCEGASPYLGYSMSLPEGVEIDDETPLTITFLNPDGENHVTTGLPLEGSLLWPGASDTEPLQWPGWELQEDGSYVETEGNFAWTRDGVQVLFEVNPSFAAVVDYPPASSECANPQGMGGPDGAVVDVELDDAPAVEAEGEGELAMTGATVGWVAGFAALLVAGGVTLFLVRRRLQQD
ncbi:hypothetical protein LEP48_12325 [Isoptericola sp. NEAU-Y5]|uniref:Uncharacterized protein n=1 Tax=Isoptericola luteus TaxID=2879484 RepID=A0ABS7ZII4_9MICO|nr:hypothetical protein [Isoptericola sp. NEAU-Y5]MCA5894126.1 hypothetical protein [Isoptericola sp. NEAU-Y5]